MESVMELFVTSKDIVKRASRGVVVFIAVILSLTTINGCSTTGSEFESLVESSDYKQAIDFYSANQEHLDKKPGKYDEQIEQIANHFTEQYRKSVTDSMSKQLHGVYGGDITKSDWKKAKATIQTAQMFFSKLSAKEKNVLASIKDYAPELSADHSLFEQGSFCQTILANAREDFLAYDLFEDLHFFSVYPLCTNVEANDQQELVQLYFDSVKPDLSKVRLEALTHFYQVYVSSLPAEIKTATQKEIHEVTLKNLIQAEGRDTAAERMQASMVAEDLGLELGENQDNIYMLFEADKLNAVLVGDESLKPVNKTGRGMLVALNGRNEVGHVLFIPSDQHVELVSEDVLEVESRYKAGSQSVDNLEYQKATREVLAARQNLENEQRELQTIGDPMADGKALVSQGLEGLGLLTAVAGSLSESAGKKDVENARLRLQRALRNQAALSPTEDKTVYEDYTYTLHSREIEKSLLMNVVLYDETDGLYDVHEIPFSKQMNFEVSTGFAAQDTSNKKIVTEDEYQRMLNKNYEINMDDGLAGVLANSNNIYRNKGIEFVEELVRTAAVIYLVLSAICKRI